jgi:hypothetical protein
MFEVLLGALIGAFFGSIISFIVLLTYTSWQTDKIHKELLERRTKQQKEAEERIAQAMNTFVQTQEINNDRMGGAFFADNTWLIDGPLFSTDVDVIKGEVSSFENDQNNVIKFPNKPKK